MNEEALRARGPHRVPLCAPAPRGHGGRGCRAQTGSTRLISAKSHPGAMHCSTRSMTRALGMAGPGGWSPSGAPWPWVHAASVLPLSALRAATRRLMGRTVPGAILGRHWDEPVSQVQVGLGQRQSCQHSTSGEGAAQGPGVQWCPWRVPPAGTPAPQCDFCQHGKQDPQGRPLRKEGALRSPAQPLHACHSPAGDCTWARISRSLGSAGAWSPLEPGVRMGPG